MSRFITACSVATVSLAAPALGLDLGWAQASAPTLLQTWSLPQLWGSGSSIQAQPAEATVPPSTPLWNRGDVQPRLAVDTVSQPSGQYMLQRTFMPQQSAASQARQALLQYDVSQNAPSGPSPSSELQEVHATPASFQSEHAASAPSSFVATQSEQGFTSASSAELDAEAVVALQKSKEETRRVDSGVEQMAQITRSSIARAAQLERELETMKSQLKVAANEEDGLRAQNANLDAALKAAEAREAQATRRADSSDSRSKSAQELAEAEAAKVLTVQTQMKNFQESSQLLSTELQQAKNDVTAAEARATKAVAAQQGAEKREVALKEREQAIEVKAVEEVRRARTELQRARDQVQLVQQRMEQAQAQATRYAEDQQLMRANGLQMDSLQPMESAVQSPRMAMQPTQVAYQPPQVAVQSLQPALQQAQLPPQSALQQTQAGPQAALQPGQSVAFLQPQAALQPSQVRASSQQPLDQNSMQLLQEVSQARESLERAKAQEASVRANSMDASQLQLLQAEPLQQWQPPAVDGVNVGQANQEMIPITYSR